MTTPRHPATAGHARRPPPARAHHAGRAGRRAHRRRCGADRARRADRVHRPVDARAVHAADRGRAAGRDGTRIDAWRPLDAALRPRRRGRAARLRPGFRRLGAPRRCDRRLPHRLHRRRRRRRMARGEGLGPVVRHGRRPDADRHAHRLRHRRAGAHDRHRPPVRGRARGRGARLPAVGHRQGLSPPPSCSRTRGGSPASAPATATDPSTRRRLARDPRLVRRHAPTQVG